METIFMSWLAPQARQRVRVNFNAITPEGFVRVRAAHFKRPAKVGSLVEVFEPTDEIEGFARIAKTNANTGLVYLDVSWESLRDLDPVLSTCTYSIGNGVVTSAPSLKRLQLKPVLR